MSIWKIFSYFSTKTYVVGTEKNCCKEMVLLSTQNTLFKLMDKKINTNLGSSFCLFWPRQMLSRLICIWASAWDFQQCGILTCVDLDEPLQPLFKLRNLKRCSVSSLTLVGYSSDKQRLWSYCAYAQADLRLCWSLIPHCWKSHALAHFVFSHYMFSCSRAHIIIIMFP